MGLDVNFKEAKVALKHTNLDLDIAKTEYGSEKKKAKEHNQKGEKATPSSEAMSSPQVVNKVAYTKAVKAIKLIFTMEGAKAFELYGNLLSNKARQP